MKKGVAILFLLTIIFLINFASSYQINRTAITTNITLQENYFHLGVSDPDLILYLPFDVAENINPFLIEGIALGETGRVQKHPF